VSNNQQLKQSPQPPGPGLPVALLALGARLVPAANRPPSFPQFSGTAPVSRARPYQTLVCRFTAKETRHQSVISRWARAPESGTFIAGTSDFGATDEQLKAKISPLAPPVKPALCRFPMLAHRHLPPTTNPELRRIQAHAGPARRFFWARSPTGSALGCPSKPITGPPLRWLRHHYAFTNSLSAFQGPEWEEKVAGQRWNWPVGVAPKQ